MQEYKTKIADIKYLTLHTVELTVDLVSPDGIEYEAGQFMEFRVGDVMRSYSIVSVPDHNTSLKFCISLVPGGAASGLFKQARVGQELYMRGPFGNFTFDGFDRDSFFVAAGVGIAPFASMIPEALSQGYQGNCRLLFGLRQESDVFYFDRFSHLSTLYANFKFIPILSSPESHWPGETGRVTTYLDVAYEYYRTYRFYLCGQAEMAKDARDLLIKKGHPLADIKLEIFT